MKWTRVLLLMSFMLKVGQMLARWTFLAVALSCEPSQHSSHHASRVYANAPDECAQRYAPPDAGETVDIVLHVSVEMPEFELHGICIRLDDGAVLVADSLELGNGKTAERHIAVTRAPHTLHFFGSWQQRSYRFEVVSKHSFDASGTTSITARAYEMNGDRPLQDRPRVEWKDAQ